MTPTPLIRNSLRELSRIPFSVCLAGAILLLSLLTGSVWGRSHDHIAASLGASIDRTVVGGDWLSILNALVVPRGPLSAVLSILGVLMLLGAAERILGTRKTAIGWLIIGVASIAIGLGIQSLGSSVGEAWAEFSTREITLNPLIGVFGPLLWASALAPALWRRRIRLWSFGALVTVLLYDGNAAVLYATVAALLGLGVGAVWPHPNRHRHGLRASARETRTLFGTLLALSAIGPLVGLIRHDSDSPLSPIVFLIERQNVILILLAIVLVIAFGLSRGTRWGYVGAISINVFVATLGLARVDFTLLLSDTEVPSQTIEVFIWNFTIIGVPLAFIVAMLLCRRLLVSDRLDSTSSPADRVRARALLERHGGTLSYLTMWAGNRYWFRADGNGFVAYRVHNGIALTTTDPVCPPDLLADTVREFARACDQLHLIPAFYSASSALLPITNALGWSQMSVGEETVIHTAGLDFQGSAWANVRNGLRRGEREGLRTVWTRWADLSFAERRQLLAISEEWVAEKALPEMGFTLGSLRELDDPHVWLMLVVDTDDRIQAVTSWLPSYQDGHVIAWTNDFMRRAPETSGRVMEFVIARMALQCAELGIATLSLSGAPLAAKPEGVPADGTQPEVLRRLAGFLARTLEPAYGFQSLFVFKSKFNPDYRTLWLFVPDPLALPAVGIAITRAYLPDTKTRELLGLARSLG